jgi:hypothetical protein
MKRGGFKSLTSGSLSEPSIFSTASARFRLGVVQSSSFVIWVDIDDAHTIVGSPSRYASSEMAKTQPPFTFSLLFKLAASTS